MQASRRRPQGLIALLVGTGLLLAACQPAAAPAAPTAVPAKPTTAAAVPSPAVPALAASPNPSPSPSPNPVTTGSEVVPAPASAAIRITAPTASSPVPAGAVRVAYDVTNATLVVAAEAKKVDDLHVHVLLDVDPAPYLATTTFIPLGNPAIIHTAAKEVTFPNVSAGQHKITVILTGANHISVRPPVSETVTFTAQ